MKKEISILIFMLISFTLFSQSNNAEINEINKKIENAINKEDYKLAEKLKNKKNKLTKTNESDLIAEYNYLRNGFFMDGMFSIGQMIDKNNNSSRIGPSVRAGYRWIFTDKKKYKPGVQLTFLRLGAFYVENEKAILVNINPASLGFVNTIQTKKHRAILLNLNIGYNLTNRIDGRYFAHGIIFNPEFKFMMKKTYIGVMYDFMHSFKNNKLDSEQMQFIGFTMGTKF